ncbi:MAG: ribosome biogenesis protein [Euryarchaeota archaeon]|nr:ribosome biogenesis protein [Euryarchaeota archaeon]|tara:strand:+ start:229 stop:435 length:207 start_codon:yes stop_codon:yes gene_type:complete
MARQLIQKCKTCGAYSYELICPICGGNSQAAAPLKWTPEDPQAHRRRKMNEVESETWNDTLPSLSEEE